MEQEKDQDLLVITSMVEEPEERDKAFTAFCERYKDFLWNSINEICKRHPNHYELSRAIYSNTIINVYQYSGSFSVDEKLEKNVIQTKIEGWLISIAKREFISLVSNKDQPIDPFEITSLLADDEAVMKIENFMDEATEETLFSEGIVNKALSLLPRERDRHILMTYFQYYEKGKGDQAKNLNPRIRRGLAEKYNTTEDNIRQIISRSKKIVFEFLKKNYKL